MKGKPVLCSIRPRYSSGNILQPDVGDGSKGFVEECNLLHPGSLRASTGTLMPMVRQFQRKARPMASYDLSTAVMGVALSCRRHWVLANSTGQTGFAFLIRE